MPSLSAGSRVLGNRLCASHDLRLRRGTDGSFHISCPFHHEILPIRFPSPFFGTTENPNALPSIVHYTID